MPNLVGIGNSQVPTNAMLGGLAYQDPTNVVLKNVEPGNIKSIKRTSGLLSPYESNGSGEVTFVYDTSKDSDGGAWRKKTQHTSWYQEGTNLYRGSRKEFPSIAVITSTQAYVDIYDGDDPNLSLWMRFRVGNPYVISCNGDYASCITAKNGMLVIGEYGSYGGVNIIDFVKDEIRRLRGAITSNGTHGMWPTGIWGRNGSDRSNRLWATGRGYDNYNIGQLISDNVNSVAIFTHDSSPRDRVTGLPYPTIAVACASGISIISARHFEMISYAGGMGNTGSGGNAIYDMVCGNGSYTIGRSVEWNEFGDLIFVMGDGNGDSDYIYTCDQYFTQEADNFTVDAKSAGLTRLRNAFRGNYNHTAFNAGAGNISGFLSQGSSRNNTDNTHQHKINHLAAMKGHQFATSTRNGLAQIVENPNVHWADSSSESSLIAYTGHSFASGWCYGRPGIITLCTTDDTDLVGTELISNTGLGSNMETLSQFSNTTGWSATNGSISVDSGNLKVTGSSSSTNAFMYTSVSLVQGELYTLAIKSNQIFSYTRIGTNNSLATQEALNVAIGQGWITHTFEAPTTATYYIKLGMVTSYATGNISAISLRKAERDYSVYDKSPSVFGTITKNKVNGNSDLCYYTGWSSSNYIWKYYSGKSDIEDGLDHGTGDFYYNFWINPQDVASGTVIFSKSTSNNGMYTRCYTNGDDIRFDLSTSGSGYNDFQAAGNYYVQEHYSWACVVGIRRDRHFEIWINGKLQLRNEITVASVYQDSFSSDNHVLKIGYDPNTASSDSALRLALFRSGFGAPSKQQIEKMYFDERGLFGPDAKCTLVGSTNDRVEALDYDSHTDLLHVGGSQGRADFSGLVRINNNTTPVTRALSAEKGMIAEY